MASMATFICKSPTNPSTSHPQVLLGLPVSHRSIWSSYADLPCRSLTWNKQIKLRNRVTLFQMVSRPERFTNLYNPLRLDVPRSSRGRHLRISSFKGNAQNGELGDKSSKSTFPKNSVGISYVPQDTNSTKLQDVSIPCASQSNDAMPNSKAIHKLFRHWVALLWADSHAQIDQEIIERPAKDVLQPEKVTYLKERGEVSKVVVRYFLGLDASVKIPLLILCKGFRSNLPSVPDLELFGYSIHEEITLANVMEKSQQYGNSYINGIQLFWVYVCFIQV